MKKKFTEAQIIFALRQAESGTPIAEIIRKMEISEVTFYRWKKKYAGMGVAELRRSRVWLSAAPCPDRAGRMARESQAGVPLVS